MGTARNHRGLTRQREAFCQLVARGEGPADAVGQLYPDARATTYSSELMANPSVAARIEILEQQFQTIAELNRDSLTVEAIETARHARSKEKFSASISGLRLAGDLQGLTQSNPVAEATAAFLGFLAGGNAPNNVLTDVTETENEP